MAESVKRGSEGEFSGGRGAIVVKENPAWRGRILDPQDAGTVETHLTSRAPKGSGRVRNNFEPIFLLFTASLRKLEKMRGVSGRSLLGSLEQVEVRTQTISL